MTLKKRDEVSIDDQWDLESVYPNIERWELSFRNVTDSLPGIKVYTGKLNTKAQILDCLDLFFAVDRTLGKLCEFAEHKGNEDLANRENRERVGRARDLNTAFSSATAFIEPELASLEITFLKELLEDRQFEDYDFYLQKVIRNKEHLLSLAEEELLAQFEEIREAPHEIFGKLSDNDLIFPDVEKEGKPIGVTCGSYQVLIEDPDRNVRKGVTGSILSTYKQFRTTFAESLYAHIKQNVVMARVRNHSSALGMFLHANNIPASVYKTLFSVARESLGLLDRYCKIRRKKLKLDDLHGYDLYVPLIKNIKNRFSYDEAVDMVVESVAPLGSNYVQKLKAGLTHERWVDRYENKGKHSGAYSGGAYDTRPFILMNYNGTLDSVSTLTHEGGHSMHKYLAIKAQPSPKHRFVIFTAEVASILNQFLLNHYLLQNAGKEMRAFVINQELEDIRTIFFRQVMFAEFEAGLYEHVWNGGVLTPDFMEELHYNLNREYYKSVVIDDLIRSEWSRVPHFYYDFYVYQYATSLACSYYFSSQILNGGKKELDNYLNLLRAGGSDYPINLLKKAGLDVTNPKYLISLMKRFETLLDEFEKIV